jgi:hypothetical protein
MPVSNARFSGQDFGANVMSRFLFPAVGVLQFFIAIGALAGGIVFIIAPDGSIMQMPVSVLAHSPFSDFLIPGLILFLFNGVGNLVAGIFSVRRLPVAGFLGIFFGLGLIIWIFVQVSVIGGVHWLQYLYFSLGMMELLGGIAMRELVAGGNRRRKV